MNSMLRGLRLFLPALLVLLPGAVPEPRRDIDVGVPPGTPLDWSAQLFRPLTTARHGLIPPKPDRPRDDVITGGRETTFRERVPEPLLVPFGQKGLYDHFRVTTFDTLWTVLR